MKFSLFDKFGALNSQPVFAAFAKALDRAGIARCSHDIRADVAVIWSTVWSGRMRSNQRIFTDFRRTGRPVVVLEVGTVQRGRTWKVGINGTGLASRFHQDTDAHRPHKLGVHLQPWRSQGDHVLICCQREDSEQWQGMPSPRAWLHDVVSKIRSQSSRPIWIRPHPRRPAYAPAGTKLLPVNRLINTYDCYDIDDSITGAHCVVNWNSGPASRACVMGVPVFVGPDSQAAPVGNLDWNRLETPLMPPRDQWLIDLCHTEWCLDEIEAGVMLDQLLVGIKSL